MNVYVRISVPQGVDPAEFLANSLDVEYHRMARNPDLQGAAELACRRLQTLVEDPNVIRGVIPKQDARDALHALREALGWPNEIH